MAAAAESASATTVVGHQSSWDIGGVPQAPMTSSAAAAAADVVARVVSEMIPCHDPMMPSGTTTTDSGGHHTMMASVQFQPDFVVQPQIASQNGKGKQYLLCTFSKRPRAHWGFHFQGTPDNDVSHSNSENITTHI